MRIYLNKGVLIITCVNQWLKDWLQVTILVVTQGDGAILWIGTGREVLKTEEVVKKVLLMVLRTNTNTNLQTQNMDLEEEEWKVIGKCNGGNMKI